MASTSKTSHFLTQEEQPKAHRDPSGEIYDVLVGSPAIVPINYASYDEVPQFEISRHEKDIENCFKVFDLESVGRGGFGTVFKCKDKEDSEKQFAVKVIRAKYVDQNYRDVWTRQAKGELAALKQLQHPKIVEYNDHCWLDHSEQVPRCYLAIKTEYMDLTLLRIIRTLNENHYKMRYIWFKRLFRDIASALVHMHDRGMVHHDLKHINIMITRVKSLKLKDLKQDLLTSPWKIIDCGNVHYYAGPKEQAIEKKFFDGTVLFSCPEKRNKIKYQPFKSDSYSLGMLCWEAIETDENVFRQKDLDRNDPDYVKKLKPAWEIIDSTVMPRLREEGKIGPHHVVARKLIAPEGERIFVSDALKLFKKEEQKMRRSRFITLNNKRQRLV